MKLLKKKAITIFNASRYKSNWTYECNIFWKIKLSNIKENESYTLSGEGQSSVGFANGSANVKLAEENGINHLNMK